MNDRFGEGEWRPLPLFFVSQSSGKDRIISDACHGEHNDVVIEQDTIVTPSPDFIPEASRLLVEAIDKGAWRQPGPARCRLPDWAHLVASTDDLEDAYGQCPAHPSHRAVCIVAWYSEDKQEWRFAESKGLVFGFKAAVTAFNRWPALILASARRFCGLAATNYFDDFLDISTQSAARSSRVALTAAADLNGGEFGEPKAVPHRQQPTFIGVVATLDEVADTGSICLAPKAECKASIKAEAAARLAQGVCTPAQASKLRGRAGWSSARSA